ncbi:hypothetical protein M1555_04250 [Patescibacteria group bacterium]|nr:hypothetical protein [Patescibacteria group bacterium]
MPDKNHTTPQGTLETLFRSDPALLKAVQIFEYAKTQPEWESKLTTFLQQTYNLTPGQYVLTDRVFGEAIKAFARHYLFDTESDPSEGQTLASTVPLDIIESAFVYPERHLQEETYRSFARRLTENYYNQTERYLRREQAEYNARHQLEESRRRERVAAAIADAAQKAQSADVFEVEARRILDANDVVQNIGPQRAADLVLRREMEVFSPASAVRDRARAITDEMLRSRTNRPDLLAATLVEQSASHPNTLIASLVPAAEREAAALGVITAAYVPGHPGTPPDRILRAYKDGAAQLLGDVALGMLNPETRDRVIEAVKGQSFERAINDRGGLEKRFGTGTTPFLVQLRADTHKAVAESSAAALRSANAHGLADRWLAPLLLRWGPGAVPVDETAFALVGFVQSSGFSSFRPPTPPTTPPTAHPGLVPGIYAQKEGALQFLSAVWGCPEFHLATLVQQNMVSVRFSYLALSQDLFLWITTIGSPVKKAGAMGTLAAIGKSGLSTGLAILLAPETGGLSLIGKMALSFSIDKLTNGISGAFRFFSNPTGKEDRLAMNGWLLPFLIIALTLIPLWLLSTAFMRVTSGAFSVTSKQIGSGPPAGTPIIYTGPPPPATPRVPSAGLAGCPVGGGVVTQGPNGAESHRGIDAYDFAVPMGTPVRATSDGFVAAAVTSFRPNEYKYQDFGNYVRMVGSGPGGEYYTTYAHLLSIAPEVQTALQAVSEMTNSPARQNDPELLKQATIRAGTIIGYTDNTGYSTGPHLHYQYNGPGQMVLPDGCGGQ